MYCNKFRSYYGLQSSVNRNSNIVDSDYENAIASVIIRLLEMRTNILDYEFKNKSKKEVDIMIKKFKDVLVKLQGINNINNLSVSCLNFKVNIFYKKI